MWESSCYDGATVNTMVITRQHHDTSRNKGNETSENNSLVPSIRTTVNTTDTKRGAANDPLGQE